MNAQTLFIGMPEGSEWIMILAALAAALAAGILWIKAIIEIATGKFKDDTTKIVWLLIVLLTGIIGALIYMVAGRQARVIT